MFYNNDMLKGKRGKFKMDKKRKKLCNIIMEIQNEKLLDYLTKFIVCAIKEWG